MTDSKGSKIGITAPHALCEPVDYPGRICDRISKEMGRRLNSKITGSIYLEADIPRYICDLNRDECSLTKYRQGVTKLLNSGLDELLDIHSYPAGSEYSAVQDLLVLVNINLKNLENGPLATLLSEMGRAAGLDVRTAIGGKMNSIVEEALGLGIRSFLLEFNEDAPVERREKVIDLVVKWYNTYLKGRKYKTHLVVSPTYGVVESLWDNGVTVYIDPNLAELGIPSSKGNHDVFVPLSGKVDKVEWFHGSWNRKVFQADVEKIAQVRFTVEGLTTWLEVGHPKYITDRIRLDLNPQGGDEVKQGSRCGEIILGSMSGVYTSDLWFSTVLFEQKVEGGKTVIGIIIKRSDLPTS